MLQPVACGPARIWVRLQSPALGFALWSRPESKEEASQEFCLAGLPRTLSRWLFLSGLVLEKLFHFLPAGLSMKALGVCRAHGGASRLPSAAQVPS